MMRKTLLLGILLLLVPCVFSAVAVPYLGIEVKLVVVVTGTFSPYENFAPFDIIVAANGRDIEDFRLILQKGQQSAGKKVNLTIMRSDRTIQDISAKFFPMKQAKINIKWAKRTSPLGSFRNPDRLVLGILADPMLMVIKKDKNSPLALDVGDMFKVKQYYETSDLAALLAPINSAKPGDTLTFQVIKQAGLELLAKGVPEGDKYMLSDFAFTVEK